MKGEQIAEQFFVMRSDICKLKYPGIKFMFCKNKICLEGPQTVILSEEVKGAEVITTGFSSGLSFVLFESFVAD